MSIDQEPTTSQLDLGAPMASADAYERTLHNGASAHVRQAHVGLVARDEWPGTPEWHARRNQGRLGPTVVAVAAASVAPNGSRPADESSE